LTFCTVRRELGFTLCAALEKASSMPLVALLVLLIYALTTALPYMAAATGCAIIWASVVYLRWSKAADGKVSTGRIALLIAGVLAAALIPLLINMVYVGYLAFTS
jgi:hypothetical protein